MNRALQLLVARFILAGIMGYIILIIEFAVLLRVGPWIGVGIGVLITVPLFALLIRRLDAYFFVTLLSALMAAMAAIYIYLELHSRNIRLDLEGIDPFLLPPFAAGLAIFTAMTWRTVESRRSLPFSRTMGIDVGGLVLVLGFAGGWGGFHAYQAWRNPHLDYRPVGGQQPDLPPRPWFRGTVLNVLAATNDRRIICSATSELEKKPVLVSLAPGNLTDWEIPSHLQGEAWEPISAAVGPEGRLLVTSKGGLRAYSRDGTLLWEASLPSEGGMIPPSIASDGTAYVATKGKDGENLIAVTSDGTKRWEIRGDGGSFEATAVGSDGAIFVAGKKLFALRPDGTRLWEASPAQGEAFVGISIGPDGTLYVPGARGLYAFAPNGQEKWLFDAMEQSTLSAPRHPAAVATNGTIYFAFDQLYALTPDGIVKWTWKGDGFLGEAPMLGDDGRIHLISIHRTAYIISPDGRQLWQRFAWPKGSVEPTQVMLLPDGAMLLLIAGKIEFTHGSRVMRGGWPSPRRTPWNSARAGPWE